MEAVQRTYYGNLCRCSNDIYGSARHLHALGDFSNSTLCRPSLYAQLRYCSSLPDSPPSRAAFFVSQQDQGPTKSYASLCLCGINSQSAVEEASFALKFVETSVTHHHRHLLRLFRRDFLHNDRGSENGHLVLARSLCHRCVLEATKVLNWPSHNLFRSARLRCRTKLNRWVSQGTSPPSHLSIGLCSHHLHHGELAVFANYLHSPEHAVCLLARPLSSLHTITGPPANLRPFTATRDFLRNLIRLDILCTYPFRPSTLYRFSTTYRSGSTVLGPSLAQ